jgi:hypothetical protein
MDQIGQFINDPMVAPIYGVLVIALVDFALAIYRSIQSKVFDWAKLPQILDSIVLQKVIPLAALGVAAFFVTDPTAKTGLQAAYVALAVTVLAAEVGSIVSKVTGAYTASNIEMDRGLTKPPAA